MPTPATRPGEPRRKAVTLGADLGRYAGLGLTFAGTLVLTGGLGWWLDTLLGSFPWLLVAGIFVGGAAGFLAVVRAVPPARGRQPASPRDPDPPDPPDSALPPR